MLRWQVLVGQPVLVVLVVRRLVVVVRLVMVGLQGEQVVDGVLASQRVLVCGRRQERGRTSFRQVLGEPSVVVPQKGLVKRVVHHRAETGVQTGIQTRIKTGIKTRIQTGV